MNVAIDTDFLVRLSIAEHPGRKVAEALRDRHLEKGDRFAIAPQVINEFIHVVSDPRRFAKPLSMERAIETARLWWEAGEVAPIFPDSAAVLRFCDLMQRYQFGRKRVLDTSLAAVCLGCGVTHLITGNPRDYRTFDELVLIEME